MRICLILALFFSAPSFACKQGAAALGKVVGRQMNERFPLRPEKLQSQMTEVKDVLPKSLSSADEVKVATFLDEAHNAGPIKSQMQFFERKEELNKILSNMGHSNSDELAEAILSRTLLQRHIGNEATYAHALNSETEDFIHMSGIKFNDQALSKSLKALEEGKAVPKDAITDLKELSRDVNGFEMTSMRNTFSKMDAKATESKSWIDGYFVDSSKKEFVRNPSLNPYKPSVDPASLKARNPDVVKLKLEGTESGQGSWEFAIKRSDDQFVYVTDTKTGMEFVIKDDRARGILRARAYQEWAALNPREAKLKNVEVLQNSLDNGVNNIRGVMSELLGEAKRMAEADLEKSGQVLSSINQLKEKTETLAKSADDAEGWELKPLIKEVQDLFNGL